MEAVIHLNPDPSRSAFARPEPLLSLNTPTGNEQQPGKQFLMVTRFYYADAFESGNMEGITEWATSGEHLLANQGRLGPATRLDELNTNQHNGDERGEDGKSPNYQGDERAFGSHVTRSEQGAAQRVAQENRPQVGGSSHYYSPASPSSFFMSLISSYIPACAATEGANDLYRATLSGPLTQP
jgi:hypothetical protein